MTASMPGHYVVLVGGGSGGFMSTDFSKKCTVPNCGRPFWAKGYCYAHYRRNYRAEKAGRSPSQAERTRAVRNYSDEGTLAELGRVRVPREIVEDIDAAALRLGVTQYEMHRKILQIWHDSQKATGAFVAKKDESSYSLRQA